PRNSLSGHFFCACPLAFGCFAPRRFRDRCISVTQVGNVMIRNEILPSREPLLVSTNKLSLRVPRFRFSKSISYHGRHDKGETKRLVRVGVLSRCELGTYDV